MSFQTFTMKGGTGMTQSSLSTGPVQALRKDANENLTKVLHAAKLVFAEKGLDATIENVATKAGVGVGTVYRRFSNKNNLAEAVISDIFSKIYEEQLEIMKNNYPADEKIKLIYEHFAKISKEYGKIHDMALDFIQGSDMEHSFYTHFKKIVRMVIVQGQNEGVFREGNPEIYEIFIFNMANPKVAYQLKKLMPPSEIPEHITKMILKGIAQ